MSISDFFPARQELDDLARRIRAALQASRPERCNALHHDLDIGDMLTEVQAQVTTGWKRWLRENCFLSERTALLYQQLARHRTEIEAEIERVGELSLRAARRLIAKPDKENPPNEKQAAAEQELLPRAYDDPQDWHCRMCGNYKRCWGQA
jgi:hypothetical protein